MVATRKGRDCFLRVLLLWKLRLRGFLFRKNIGIEWHIITNYADFLVVNRVLKHE